MRKVWILKSRDGEIEAASFSRTKMMQKAVEWFDAKQADKVKFVEVGGKPIIIDIRFGKQEWGMIVGIRLE